MQIWKKVTSCSLGVKDKAKDACVIYFIPDMAEQDKTPERLPG